MIRELSWLDLAYLVLAMRWTIVLLGFDPNEQT